MNMPDEIVYRLEDKPPFYKALFAGLQHLLAMFVGIITPAIIIGSVLGLNQQTPYLISMSLMVSGVATFIQIHKFGPLGSGLLSIQGTSFAFLGAILVAGSAVKKQGGKPEDILALIFGVCFFGAFVEIILSRFLHHLKKVITPLVTGIVVTIIGLSLIKVGITDMGGGHWLLVNKPESYGHPLQLALAFLVMSTIVICNQSKNSFFRMSSIFVGLAIGYIAALCLGKVDLSGISQQPLVSIPQPFKYGFSFDLGIFISIALIYLITAIETIGDLTATSQISQEPIEGEIYMQRIKGGVLADGFNSLLAATFNTFPNTTFSQNNGVIQITGVASRYVGYFVAVFLVVLGLFPAIAWIFQQMPKPVLGGATIIMFGAVAASGIRIIATSHITRRSIIIISVSFGLGLGVGTVPEFLQHIPALTDKVFGSVAIGETFKQIFSSAITTGGLAAIVCNIVLPADTQNEASYQ